MQSLDKQTKHCNTCGSQQFSKENINDDCVILKLMKKNNPNSNQDKICPCSECIIKMICTDVCLPLEDFINIVKSTP